MDYIQMVVYEFLLDSSIIALNNTVDFRTPWINKQMTDIGFFEYRIEFSKVFRAVVEAHPERFSIMTGIGLG